MSFSKLVNTKYFREAATDFDKNKGAYTRAPRGSREYLQYWEMHEERCLNGYSVGDLWIPGRYYFFLNFTPMLKVSYDKLNLLKSKDYGTLKKIVSFPDFREVHYEWGNFKSIAWHGGSFMGISSKGGQHIGCLKARRAGWSYYEAADGAYNYNFIEGSKSFYFAGLEDYLIKDGILNKVYSDLEWINTHIPFWKQNRQKKDTLMHMRASYLNSRNQEEGSFAEIMGVSITDPNKVRGKNGIKLVYEEGGSFRNLKAAYDISRGTVEDSAGMITTGQISVFGTGGEEGPGIIGLDTMFNDPVGNNMLAFPYIWEAGMDHESCGYFVPSTRINALAMDEDGNADMVLANILEDAEQAKIKDPETLDRRRAEYCRTPSEALMRTKNIQFVGKLLDRQIARIRGDRGIQSLIRHGKLFPNDKKEIEFAVLTAAEAKPILKFPHSQMDDLSGCVTVYEQPYRDINGHVPAGIYQVVFDPYYAEEAEDKTSLFSIYVIKLDNKITSSFTKLPVASYIGRPTRLEDCYETLFNLAKYYNCTVQGEIAGGGQGVIDYARRKHLLHMVEYEPEMLHNKEISKGKNRSFLMAMHTERKIDGLTYLVEWHKEIRGLDANGNPIYNTDRIYDLGFLLEMKKFTLASGNFDRISAMIIGMYMIKEKPYEYAKKSQEDAGMKTQEELAYPDVYQAEDSMTTSY